MRPVSGTEGSADDLVEVKASDDGAVSALTEKRPLCARIIGAHQPSGEGLLARGTWGAFRALRLPWTVKVSAGFDELNVLCLIP